MSIQGFAAPLMLEGSRHRHDEPTASPPCRTCVVQKYNGKGYAPAEQFG